jgi:Holliday junction resolvasome RuvABC endonuclease subunit
MPHKPARIFAIDPSTRGFGYVVFELPFRLVEWGLGNAVGEKNSGAVAVFEKLLDRFRPETVVLEDTEAPGSRRQPRVRALIAAMVELAKSRGIAVATVARKRIQERFAPEGAGATKRSIAERLVRDFPELRASLPGPRKPWESEDRKQSIFDALALAVTHAVA